MISEGHQVTVIQSDFKHIKKTRRHDEKRGFLFVDTMTYNRNISARRLISHYLFSKKVAQIAEDFSPELIYSLIPPNSIMKNMARLKKKMPKTKFIFDIIDLWPETFPTGSLKQSTPFKFWRNLRDKNIYVADYLVTECDLYREVLGKRIVATRCSTLYLAKRPIELKPLLRLSMDDIHLGYLGSINNIIDIEKITEIIASIQKYKPVILHIVGAGENKDRFVSKVSSTGAKVVVYGEIFDTMRIQEIFSQCHFGINVMKESVCVGLTMKSIDYFQIGLPVLNNIKADTRRFVEKHKTGYNLSEEKSDELALKIARLNPEEMMEMRISSRDLFEKHFSQEVFNKTFKVVLDCFE
jgi:glycosyltransferase involved in cell wall biosynthesis